MRQHVVSCLVNCAVLGCVPLACWDIGTRRHAKTCRKPLGCSRPSVTGSSEPEGMWPPDTGSSWGHKLLTSHWYQASHTQAWERPDSPPAPGMRGPSAAQLADRGLSAREGHSSPAGPSPLPWPSNTRSASLCPPASQSFCFHFIVSVATTSLPLIVSLPRSLYPLYKQVSFLFMLKGESQGVGAGGLARRKRAERDRAAGGRGDLCQGAVRGPVQPQFAPK